MKFLPLLLIILSGCSSISTVGNIGVEARATAHAAMIANARETIREAQDWRTLALEAEAAMTPNE